MSESNEFLSKFAKVCKLHSVSYLFVSSSSAGSCSSEIVVLCKGTRGRTLEDVYLVRCPVSQANELKAKLNLIRAD